MRDCKTVQQGRENDTHVNSRSPCRLPDARELCAGDEGAAESGRSIPNVFTPISIPKAFEPKEFPPNRSAPTEFLLEMSLSKLYVFISNADSFFALV